MRQLNKNEKKRIYQGKENIHTQQIDQKCFYDIFSETFWTHVGGFFRPVYVACPKCCKNQEYQYDPTFFPILYWISFLLTNGAFQLKEIRLRLHLRGHVFHAFFVSFILKIHLQKSSWCSQTLFSAFLLFVIEKNVFCLIRAGKNIFLTIK